MSDLIAIVPEGNTLVILARIAGVDGTDITQASLASVVWNLKRLDTLVDIVADTSLTVASCVFDTLQTFVYPSGRTYQYNFKHVISGTYLTLGGIDCQALYTFTDTAGYPYVLNVSIPVKDLT